MLQTGDNFMKLSEMVNKRLGEIEFPFLTLHGTGDKTIPIRASEKLMELSKTHKDKKQFISYNDACHELLHDPDTPTVINDMMSWLNKQFQ